MPDKESKVDILSPVFYVSLLISGWWCGRDSTLVQGPFRMMARFSLTVFTILFAAF